MSGALRFLGRLLIAGIFVMGGWSKIQSWDAFNGTVAYAGSGFQSWGIPVPANVLPILVGIATALEFFGGIAMVLGLEQFAATLLALFLVPITFVMHKPNPEDQASVVGFLKNLSLLGGMLVILSVNMAKSAGKAKKQ